MLRWLILLITHGAMLAAGFALGVYLLPILTAQPGPSAEAIASASANTMYSGAFDRNLPGSDFLHWGEGEVKVTAANIVHTGLLAPGPDYKLYLTADFVDTKDAFLAIKDNASGARPSRCSSARPNTGEGSGFRVTARRDYPAVINSPAPRRACQG
jgi:hypothetical protein